MQTITCSKVRETFENAIHSGALLVLAGMPDPDHTKTHDPLVSKSPLLRLLAVALEHTDTIVFAPEAPHAAAVTICESHADVQKIAESSVPRFGYWNEALSGDLIVGWVSLDGITVDLKWNTEDAPFGDSSARLDPVNPKHRAALIQLIEHADSQDWDTFAARLRELLVETPRVVNQ